MGVTAGELILWLRGDDSKLVKDLDSAEKKSESASISMAKTLGTAIAGGAAIAGAAILAIGGKAWDVASEIDAATDQIGASLGLGADEAKAYGEAIKSVYGDNFGDSIGDVGEAVEEVAKQLKLTANDPALTKVTANAFRLRDVFKTDIKSSVDAARTLMENFGLTSEQAFDMLASGYQKGLDRSGDFLDTIGEYSTQFAAGGATAGQFFSLLESGLQGGVLGTDKAADAFKEFRLRIADGSTLTASSLAAIGLNVDDITSRMHSGTLSAADAFTMVQDALNATADPVARMQAGVGLIGTQFEDLGDKVATSLTLVNDWQTTSEGAAASLDTKYTSLGSAFEGMWRDFQVGIAPAGEALLTLANDNLPAIQGVVNTVSGAIVTAVGLLPLAIAGAHKLWDEDWAGIRTTWEDFANEMPKKQEEFWVEWKEAFGHGSQENEDGWEKFFAGVFGRANSWGTFTSDLLILVLKNWNNTTAAFHALSLGDWSTFWSSLGENFTNAFDVLLSFLDIFKLGFKEKMVGGLQDAWDGLKSLWTDFAGWWNDTFGGLLGLEPVTVNPGSGGGGGGFGDSYQPKIDAVNNYDPLRGVVGPSTDNRRTSIKADFHINGAGDPVAVGNEVEAALVRILEAQG